MIANVLFILVGIVLILSAATKFIGVEKVIGEFKLFNLLKYRFFASTVELVAGIILLFPETRFLGTLLTTSYLGGVMTCCFQHLGLKNSLPAMALTGLVWAGCIMQHLGF